MVVESGQVPYEFDAPLPIRAPSGAWPGIDTPNIAMSGITIEQAMFVYNAELRKWDFTGGLDLLQYNLYTHPDITPSGFEPKANGDTLEGLVGGLASLESIDNIEELRTQLSALFDLYAVDSVYDGDQFLEAWLLTAYKESPSGSIEIIRVFPSIDFFDFLSPEFLHPPLSDVTGGDFITTTDTHWLGGSGVIFDIDCGEVVFNPFPFPRESFIAAPGLDANRFNFGPIYPLVQTTLGVLPSVVSSRYESDLAEDGAVKREINIDAIGSGMVQIDGYALVGGTTIELVIGNDSNFETTVLFSDDYIGHIPGLRVVNDGDGDNDPTARVYRFPTAQASGLYRLLTHSQKVNVPFTAIPSGYVSIWPEGGVRQIKDEGILLSSQNNFIHGREITVTSDGGLQRDARDSTGLHVMDDAIWITSRNDSNTSGTLVTRGMYPSSPYNGELVWYRPAELAISESGNLGPGQSTFYTHLGLMDIGDDWVRIARTASSFGESNTGTPTPDSDRSIVTSHFQRYNKTTLNHTETSVGYERNGEDATLMEPNFIRGWDGGAILDSTDVYIYEEFGKVHKFDTSLNFVDAYDGPIAKRRHVANGQLLYTRGGNVTGGDPLLSITGGSSSGIGVWSTTDPTGAATDVIGTVNHDSAKPFRGETHFGNQTSAIWHTIFDVANATHVANGVWGILQLGTTLYLIRMTEEASFWLVQESIRLERPGDSIPVGDVPADFPYEAAAHLID